MRHRPQPHIADRAVAALRRRGMVWLLLLVLPLHGLSAALIGLLGQRHFHAAVPTHALGRVLWQGQIEDPRPDTTAHAHAHAALERHHHARDDASVIALDPAVADDAMADAGTTGASPSMLAPPPSARLAPRSIGRVPWQSADTGRFVSWSSQPPERPPKV